MCATLLKKYRLLSSVWKRERESVWKVYSRRKEEIKLQNCVFTWIVQIKGMINSKWMSRQRDMLQLTMSYSSWWNLWRGNFKQVWYFYRYIWGVLKTHISSAIQCVYDTYSYRFLSYYQNQVDIHVYLLGDELITDWIRKWQGIETIGATYYVLKSIQVLKQIWRLKSGLSQNWRTNTLWPDGQCIQEDVDIL